MNTINQKGRNMKFLAIGKPKDMLTMLPPATLKQLIETTQASNDKLKKEGKLLEGYGSPAGCIAVILEYNSAEEWMKDQRANPILGYYDQEIYPLADMEDVVKGYLNALKKL
jgi:hypothetical protein